MPVSYANLGKALESTPIGEFDVAVIATTWEGVIGYWNAEAERLYGWKADEVLGANIVDVTPSLSERAQAEAIMRRLREGRPWEGEMALRRRGGADFRAFVIDTPLPANDPGNCAIIGASAPFHEADRVRIRNALLRCELRRHLGDLWPFGGDDADWTSCGPALADASYYRCYMLDAAGRFRVIRDGLFSDDAAALAFGRECLAGMQAYAGFELWNGGRFVSRHTRP